MSFDFDFNNRITKPLFLPCGGTAYFDFDSGIGYRCERCGEVVGSIGQLRECAEEAKKYEVLTALGGKGWNYKTGKPL